VVTNRRLPPNASNDVVFDTSALTRCLDEPALLARLTEKFVLDGGRMVVPLIALSEVIAHDSDSVVLARGAALRSLRAARVDLRFSLLGHEIHALEDGRQIMRTPTLGRERERITLRFLPGWWASALGKPDLPAFRRHVAKDKDRLHAADQQKHRKLRQFHERRNTTIQGIVGVLRRPEDWLPHLDWLVENALKRAARRGRHWAHVARRLERYKAAVAWAGCAFLTMWGGGIPNDAGHSEAQRLRVKRGTWYDNEITASAAYARMLVANDRDVLHKAALLFEHGLVVFSARTLDEFMA
jgi:hypothetical protein